MELRSLVQSLALLLIYGSSVARLESSRASASGECFYKIHNSAPLSALPCGVVEAADRATGCVS